MKKFNVKVNWDVCTNHVFECEEDVTVEEATNRFIDKLNNAEVDFTTPESVKVKVSEIKPSDEGEDDGTENQDS